MEGHPQVLLRHMRRRILQEHLDSNPKDWNCHKAYPLYPLPPSPQGEGEAVIVEF